jgi:hypothetical protein
MTTPTTPAPTLSVVPNPPATAPAAPPAGPPKNGAPAPTPEAAKAAAVVAEKLRMLKIKVDGLDETELPEGEVIKLAAHNAKTLIAAQQQAVELANLKRRLQEDPDALLSELGLDLDKRAVERISKKVQSQIDDETLTPEQKELRQLRAEREARTKADSEREGNEKKTAHENQVAIQKEHFASVIVEALKQTTLPQGTKDEQLFTTKLLAQELKRSIDHKLFVNPTILAKATEETFKSATKPVLAKMAAEYLADFIGPEALKGLVRIYAQRQGLASTKPAPDGKKTQTAAEKRALEKAGTQEYFGGTRRAWRR